MPQQSALIPHPNSGDIILYSRGAQVTSLAGTGGAAGGRRPPGASGRPQAAAVQPPGSEDGRRTPQATGPVPREGATGSEESETAGAGEAAGEGDEGGTEGHVVDGEAGGVKDGDVFG